MLNTNKKIDHHLRRQATRRILVIVIVTTLFVGFMSYALYREYGPGAENVDYFHEANRDEQGPDK